MVVARGRGAVVDAVAVAGAVARGGSVVGAVGREVGAGSTEVDDVVDVLVELTPAGKKAYGIGP